MGGSNDSSNLVDLTASEHFVAHLLLVKMYPTNHSLAHAAKILMGCGRYNNKQFAWVRKIAVKTSAEFHTGRKRSKETCEKISKSLIGKRKGVKFSKEHCEKISIGKTGVEFTDEHRKNISKAKKGIPVSEERKKSLSATMKMIAANTDFIERIKSAWTPEKRKIQSEKLKNVENKKCPHCGKLAWGGNYTRWHGDNCKEKYHGL